MVMIPRKLKQWRSLAFFAGDKIYTDISEQSNMDYIRVCNESTIKLLKSTSITLLIVVVSMNIYVGFPITASMFSDELQLPIPVFLPFTDYSTHYGLILNLINNVYVGGIGLAGNVGVEIITSMLKNTVWVCTYVLCHSIRELSILLESPQDGHTKAIASQFRNILLQIQDLDR